MEETVLAQRLGQLRSVTLEALDGQAALLTRRERKYIVPLASAAALVEAMADRARILEIDGRRRFRYESVYFDTPGHASYLLAAWRRPRRYKVRTRAYLDTGRCVLEVKLRDARGHTVKTQHEHALDARDRLAPADRALVGAFPLIAGHGAELEPALTTRYQRATLLLDESASRVTFDTGVTAQAPDGRIAELAGMVIIESKVAGPPSAVDRRLWAMGHRPIRVSKFGTSLAALFPELPSNRWTRALGQPWTVQSGV